MPINDSNLTDSLDRTITSDIYDVAIVSGAKSIGITATEAYAKSSKLSNRKCLVITNLGPYVVYWGLHDPGTGNSLTSSNGTPIYKFSSVTLTVGDNIAIHLISTNASSDVRIVEFS